MHNHDPDSSNLHRCFQLSPIRRGKTREAIYQLNQQDVHSFGIIDQLGKPPWSS